MSNKKQKKFFLTSITIKDKIFFNQNLEILIKTGFSIAEALKTIVKQISNKKFKFIIQKIQKKVQGGTDFSTCLRDYPKVFPELYVNIIQAGELSGKLDESLEQLTIQMKKSHNLRMKIRNALLYPAIILIAMVGIGIMVLVYVIPKISLIYEDSDFDLPISTQIVIGISNFFVDYILFIGIGIIILIPIAAKIFSMHKPKQSLHFLLLKLPIVGAIIKKINLARFTRTLSSLLATDIPIVNAFQIISKTMSNVIYKDFIYQASLELKKGVSVSNIIKKEPKLFPPTVVQIIDTGERSGTLDTITKEIAVFYEEEIDNTMSNLSVIIEPILMIILGTAVGLMALAIISPMYSLVNQM